MTKGYEVQFILENRRKLVPAAIQPIPEQNSFKIKVFDKPVKVRKIIDMDDGSAATITTETRIVRDKNGEKKYISSCFLNKVSTPVWYTESIILDLEENTKKSDVKVYYDDLYQPYRWQESFNTDLTSSPKSYVTEVKIPVNQENDRIHYISLEPQQNKFENSEELNHE